MIQQNIRFWRHARQLGAAPALIRLLCLGFALLPAAASAVGTQMFTTVEASTGEKPQSKIWYHDGSYWAILRGPSGVAFYEKVGTNWQLKSFANAVLTTTGQADVKWNGTDLFVLNYVLGGTNRLYKYTYASAMRAWVLVTGFPVNLPNPSGSETMVLDQDSTGRLWATAEGGGNINAWYSTSADHRTWIASPVVLQTGVLDDDISSVIAFGGDKIGVFWSDQNRWNFGFRVHLDSNPPTTWSTIEVVVQGTGISDDHINLACDAAGQVYAVSKDVNNRMRLHKRSTAGSWTTQTDVIAGTGTRGIVQISNADAKIYILFTDWDVSPFTIQYRVANLSNLTFGATTTFISTTSDMNNVTGTKQSLPAGNLIAIAENITHCWFNSIGSLAPPAPGPPLGLQATLASNPSRVDLTWSLPASGTPTGYNVYRQVNGGTFVKLNSSPVTPRAYTDNSPPASPLCYQVTALAATVEGSPSAPACVDNSPLPAPNPPQNLSVSLVQAPDIQAAVQLDFDAGSGQIALDSSGNGNNGRFGSSTGTDTSDPTWIAGHAGQAVRFDGSNDYIEIADSPTLDLPGSFTVEAWIQFDTGAGTGTLVNKGDSGSRTYRIRITSGRDVEFRWDTTTGSAREALASGAIPDAGWHHVACVYDQPAGENRIYVDGDLLATQAATGTPATNAAVLHVGTRFTSSFQNYLKGAVDGLRIAPQVVYSGTVAKPTFRPPHTAGVPQPRLAAERAELAWQPPTGGVTAASYNVYRATNGGTFTRLNAAPLSTTSYLDGVLAPGSYCYRVTGINSQGLEGTPSGNACADVLPPLPSAPQGFTAQLVQTPGTPVPGAAAYDFDASTGQTFEDVLGHGHTGTRGAPPFHPELDPLWAAGIFGNCLRFDGLNDRASILDGLDLQFASSFTLEAWIAPIAASGARCLLSKGSEGQVDYGLGIDAAGKLRLRWRDASGAEHGVTSAAAIAAEEWHHVAGVYDAAAGESRVFVDGVPVGSSSETGQPATSTAPLLVGTLKQGANYTQAFYGSIDLLRITPEALYDATFTPPLTFAPPTDRRVDLAWTALQSPLVAGYNVYRAVNGGAPVRLNPVTIATNLFTDLTLPEGNLCYSIATLDTLGRESATSPPQCIELQVTDTEIAPIAKRFGIAAAPNPFNPTTTLSFELPRAAIVRLSIYDARGRRVTTLVDGSLAAGPHTLRWDGRSDRGVRAPSGTYFALLRAGDQSARRKLILLQ